MGAQGKGPNSANSMQMDVATAMAFWASSYCTTVYLASSGIWAHGGSPCILLLAVASAMDITCGNRTKPNSSD